MVLNQVLNKSFNSFAKFRENTVTHYTTLRLAPLRRIALLLHYYYPTARASKAHRPTPTPTPPYSTFARLGGHYGRLGSLRT